MRVLLLGATGRTGKLILQQLVTRGHDVHVLVRDKNCIDLISPYINVFEGSSLDADLLNTAMARCDAVISALNISRKNDFPWSALRTPVNLLSATMGNLIPLLAQHQIKRIIILSAWGVSETRKDIPAWFRWTINNSNISFAYKDHELQEQMLMATDLYWTILRPVGLTNFGVKPVEISLNNRPRPSLLISRKSVAAFTADILEQAELIKLAPTIFN
ncbi:MAG: NAD(P)-binding oxidoreductase [Bacteroidota bacterium]